MGGLGQLFDHEVGGDREVAAEPQFAEGISSRFSGWPGANVTQKAIGFPRTTYLFLAVAFGVERFN